MSTNLIPLVMSPLDRATLLLNRMGVRLMRLADEAVTVGIWSWTDSPEIRAALRRLDLDEAPWRYLDGPGIPDRYKGCRAPGGQNPVPVSVLYQMYHSITPWATRDQWTREHRWFQQPVPMTLPAAAYCNFPCRQERL